MTNSTLATCAKCGRSIHLDEETKKWVHLNGTPNHAAIPLKPRKAKNAK